MERTLHRRSFLATLAAGALAALGWPRPAPALPRLEGAPARAPGDVVRLDWPPGLPPGAVRVVHRLDGREVASWAPPAPDGGRVTLVAMPSDGRLAPGDHRFLLEAGGRTLDAGGFQVSPFRFGC